MVCYPHLFEVDKKFYLLYNVINLANMVLEPQYWKKFKMGIKRDYNAELKDNGKFFLVCPNANAPSRQIAVKMGLVSHNSTITPAEKTHEHKITYSLDTLERNVKAAGLKIVHRSGIFFKAFANFQWDKLLNTDIISEEYLNGCYELGQQYPDLCSSLFLLCEKSS